MDLASIGRDGERFVPRANAGPIAGWAARTRFRARQAIDLQVGTVVRDCGSWLARRRGTMLDVGCGDQPYRHLLHVGCQYFGLDLASGRDAFGTASAPDVSHYAGGSFPYPDGAFDSVFHTETLEHVVDPAGLLNGCASELRPDGKTCFTVPFQARFHYIPNDYWRFTPAALEMLMERAGFEEVRVGARGTDVVVACAKILGVCYRLGLARPLVVPLLGPMIGAALVLAHAALRFGWGSPDDCLGYTVTARRGNLGG